jgi:hypothetical protein
MKCNVFNVIGVAMLLAACSNDEVIEMKQDPITFNVTTENVTRTRADSISTTNNLNKFIMYAYYNAGTESAETTTYIKCDTVKKNKGTWSVVGGNRYWPSSGNLDFYAVANNDKDAYTYNNGTVTVTHAVNETVNKQTDLLYAVTKGMNKTANEANGVSFNFRHALSQIAFSAKCLNAHLKVTISEVKLANVKGKGTLTLPENSTTTRYDASATSSTKPADGTIGTWVSEGDATSYSFTLDKNVELKGKVDNAKNLSEKKDSNNKDVYDNYMLLIPQTTTAWTTTAESATAIEGATGSYLAVKCKIENYVDDNTTVRLWPKLDDTKNELDYVYIPVKFVWSAGHKYTYTFIFGDSSSSEGGGYDNQGNKVLSTVKYTITVDDFIDETAEDVTM